MHDYKNLLPPDFWHNPDGTEMSPEEVYSLDIGRMIAIDSAQQVCKKALGEK